MESNWSDEKSLDDTGVKRCDELSNFIFAIQTQIDEHEDTVKTLREEVDGYKKDLERVLDHFGKTGWKTTHGSIEVRERTSVRTPKTPEDKKALFEWLQKREIFWQTVSVNSNTLNALYKQEQEIAQQEGTDRTIPGIGEVETFRQIIAKPRKG